METTNGMRNVIQVIGGRNFAQQDRQTEDFYATEPKATELLLELESFAPDIWEPACGQGHISEVLINKGHCVKSTDLIDRGYGSSTEDFLLYDGYWDGDIITNPPYKLAQQFIEKSLSLIPDGRRVAMFLPIRYLEGKARKRMFLRFPPEKIYVSSSRLKCAINGSFEEMTGSAVCYSWFIWKKGFSGDTVIKWFN